ncbi:MAG: PAS domain-containing sensor histidine kinase, partial [Henriciella sp.]|uniref:PAS domain-containing sensor histidine kinase n=1 Tax=Henriciella sp. TaxID=1968823 RepID=UPI003C71DB53
THAKQDRQTLQRVQRDALIAGEKLNRSVDMAIDRLDRELLNGTRLGRIDRDYVGVDALMNLPQAAASNDAGVVALADEAKAIVANNQRLKLMSDGRFMLVHVPTVGDPIIATIKAVKWVPATAAGDRIGIYGEATASFGDRSVLPADRQILTNGSGFRYDGVLKRSATACVGIGGAEFSLCTSRSSPLVSLETGIELLLYFLLLLAPTLAVTGLYSTLRKQATDDAPRRRSDDNYTSVAGANQALQGAGLGTWSIDPATGEANIDEAGAQLLGMNASGSLPFSQFINHVHGDHREAFETTVNAAQTSVPFSSTFATSVSGGRAWIEARGAKMYSEETSTPVVSGVLFDVTESLVAKERQKSAESRLRTAIEGFPSPFALWERNKRLSYWNKAFEAVFGLDNILRPGIGHETVMLARSGNVIHERASPDDAGVMVLGLSDGRWIKLVERPTPSGGLVSFGLDVTEDINSEDELNRQKKRLKNLIQELERSEGHNAELARKYNEEKAKAERSADSKSAFLANMSHELRTPLNAINGFSEILVNEMYGPLGHKRYNEYAKDILTSGQHLLDLINDILDIAKIEAGKMTIEPKPIDLVDPVDAAVRMIRRKAEDKGIAISLQAESALPEVDADHRAVRQMVLNLLSNAIKFTDSGGRIVVGVQRRDDFVRVAVRDTGVGIPKEHLPRLAQPFEQVQETRERNYEGTGLGLALTKSFAEMHGGRFTIASEVGKGTMVSFWLPVHASAAGSDRNVA